MLRILKDGRYPLLLLPLMLLMTTMTSPVEASVPTGLDLRLLKQLTSDLSENQAISPFVLSSLMTQIWLAAAGETRREISNGLGLEGRSQLSMGQTFLPAYKSAINGLWGSISNTTNGFNGIYIRNGVSINPSFSRIVQVIYRSKIRQFSSGSAAAAEINAEVARVTRGRITNLVSGRQLNQLSLVMVSALYFKGKWRWTFTDRFSKLPFLTASGEKNVSMMWMENKLRYGRFDTFDVVELPYKNEQNCMLVLRPLKRSMTSVSDLRSKLDTINLRDILQRMYPQDVSITMPLVKMETSYNLRGSLSQIGIKRLFTPQAEFVGFGGLPFVRSDIYHKVFLEMNKEGTEGAGVAFSIVRVSASARRIEFFSLDRPFFAVVYNKRYNINLFSAYVASP